MGVGAGHYIFAAIATAIVSVILWLFPKFEDWIDKRRESRAYEVVCEIGSDKIEKIEKVFQSSGIKVKRSKLCKNKDQEMVCTFFTYGKPQNHEQAIEVLMADEHVKAFNF